jgi:chromosome segregation ATPase
MPSFQPPVKQEHYEPSECLPHSLRSLDAATKESSPGDKKRLAGQRSREKKKNYLKSLEEDVRKLSEEIDNCDTEISRCKDQLVEALKTSNNSVLPFRPRTPTSTHSPSKSYNEQP